MTYGGLSDSLKPAPLAERLTKLFGLESESLPSFEILEWKKLIDSSDINLEDWKRLCIDIEQVRTNRFEDLEILVETACPECID